MDVCIYISRSDTTPDLTELPTSSAEFISFVNAQYHRLRTNDNIKTTRMLYPQENSKQPSYDMINFVDHILTSWEIFFNIKLNAELRLRSKFLHLITKVSCHYFNFSY
jgi:hypothetical protein